MVPQLQKYYIQSHFSVMATTSGDELTSESCEHRRIFEGVAAFLFGQRELKKSPRSESKTPEKNVTKKSLETGYPLAGARDDQFCFIATIDEDWRKRGCKYVY